MHTSLGSQCQHKEWAECEIIRDNPTILHWTEQALGDGNLCLENSEENIPLLWPSLCRGLRGGRGLSLENGMIKAGNGGTITILLTIIIITLSCRCGLMIVIKQSLSSLHHYHHHHDNTGQYHHVYHLFIILLNSYKQLIGMIFLRQAHLLPDNHCPTSSIIIIIMTALHPDPGSHDGPASRTPASWSLVRHPGPWPRRSAGQ